MLKISNSQWVNTVSLIRTVINLYSFWVKLRKEFYSWIPWPGTVTFSKQTRLEWRVSPPSVLVPPSSLRSQRSFCPWSIFLLMKQQPPSPGPNGRKVWGITLPPPTPRSPDAWHSPFWRKTEGFESGPPKLSSFSNLLLDMKATAVTHYDSFFLLFSMVSC